MCRRTQVEIATDTLRNLLAHMEALAEMGIPLPIPPELADSCRKIARLAEVPVTNTEATVPAQKEAEPSNSLVWTPPSAATGATDFAAVLNGLANRDTREPEEPPRTTVRDAVLAAIQPGEEVSVGVVVERLETVGVSANRDTVSNELSRWTHEGKLERPERGKYRLLALSITHPTSDHGPLAVEERPDDEEEVDGVAAARAEGAAM